MALVAVAGFFIGVITATSFSLKGESESKKVESSYVLGGRESFAPIVEKTAPAVVSIEGVRTVFYRSPFEDFFNDPFFRRFFGDIPRKELEQKQKWLGSGFIVEYKGKDYILTNNHVIRDAEEITISLADKRRFSGKDVQIIGRDPETDVAVIRIKRDEDLPDIPPGSVDDLKVGDWVIAIGNPFGLFGTVTAGVVSAKGRSEVSLENNIYADFIQTDAAINQGNSGGPLINTEGKVVGVNTMIYSQTGGNIGIGFAVPIDIAMNVLKSLVEKGVVERGYLGVMPEDLTEEIRKALNYPYKTGIYIKEVGEGTPAKEAGLTEGDIIVKLDNKMIKDANELRKIVASKRPGEKIKITLWKNGKEREVFLKVGKRPVSEEVSLGEGEEWLGMHLLPSTSEEAQKVWGSREISGVFVSKVESGSPAYKAGILENSLITLVQSRSLSLKINGIEDIRKAKSQFKPPLVILLQLPNGSTKIVSVEGS